MHLDATEHGDALVFLHAVRGGSGQSQLRPGGGAAGRRPARASSRGRANISPSWRAPATAARATPHRGANGQGELPLHANPAPPPAVPPPTAVERRLADINPDELSPRGALELLYELKRLRKE